MAGDGRIETNLPGTFAAGACFCNKCLTSKYLISKMKDKVTENNIHCGGVRWRISTSIKVTPEQFLLELTDFKIRDLENAGQVMMFDIRSGAIP